VEASIEAAFQAAEERAKADGISAVVVIGQQQGENRYSFTVKVVNPQEDECPSWALVALAEAAKMMLPRWGEPGEGCWFTIYGRTLGEEAIIRSVLKNVLQWHLIKLSGKEPD